MVYMIAVSGGGGGGGGRTRASTVGGGGGGGGGCSGMVTLMMPAIFLPDSLKISVGSGGQGGAALAPGSPGVSSYISLGERGGATGIAIPNIILSSNATAPGGGSVGGTTGSAAGGGADAAGGHGQAHHQLYRDARLRHPQSEVRTGPGEAQRAVENGGERDLGGAVKSPEDSVLDDYLVPQIDKGIQKHHRNEGGEAADAEQADHPTLPVDWRFWRRR